MILKTPAKTPERTLARDVALSSFVMVLTFIIPSILLLLLWKQSVAYLPFILSVANDQKKFHEVLLALIPLTILGCATGLLFLSQFDRPRRVGGWPFWACFLPETLFLFPTTLIFFGYALNYQGESLPRLDYFFVSTIVLTGVWCLILSDGYMALCRAKVRPNRAPGNPKHPGTVPGRATRP